MRTLRNWGASVILDIVSFPQKGPLPGCPLPNNEEAFASSGIWLRVRRVQVRIFKFALNFTGSKRAYEGPHPGAFVLERLMRFLRFFNKGIFLWRRYGYPRMKRLQPPGFDPASRSVLLTLSAQASNLRAPGTLDSKSVLFGNLSSRVDSVPRTENGSSAGDYRRSDR